MSELPCPHCGSSVLLACDPGDCPDCGQLIESSAVGRRRTFGLETTQDWLGLGTDELPAYRTNQEVRQEYPFLAAPLRPGDMGLLGQYRIVRVLGRGGMGVVFQGEDTKLQRPVAIKAMLPGVASRPVYRDRFLRETRATASINHDHIVTIYSVEPEVPYLVMQFLQGETLESLLQRKGPLPMPSVLRIGREIAEGLAAAHERGLVHRDIKPANIWLEGRSSPLSPEGRGARGEGRVKILDFGLARFALDGASLTQLGTIVGTPAYMAPEQARSGPVDARSDLFSLGCVLYRACTNQLPFPGKDVLSILLALASDEPRPIQQINPAVPPGLSDLIGRLLARNPAQRPRSAQQVAEQFTQLEELFREGNGSGVVETTTPRTSAYLPELPANRLDELAGCTIGRFRLGRVLGQGCQGVVFRAHDQKTEQTVAVKVLSPLFPGSEAETQRFAGAMKRLLPLRHPNLVGLHAAGRSGPYAWLALEHVEGESLADRIHRHPTGQLGWRVALWIAVQIGRVLELARRQRLIHGNITPRNILIRGCDQTALLNDLVLSRALRNSALAHAVLEDKLQKEAGFLAPEQVGSESSYVDDLCDIYGLGAVVYLLLTGRPPFQGETVEETLRRIRAGVPLKPRKWDPTIPAELEWAVLKMLARRQEDRYQGPAEMLADLEKIAAGHGERV